MIDPNDTPKNQLIFVNAPKLVKYRTESSDSGPSIRSILTRQQIRKKRANLATKQSLPANPVSGEPGAPVVPEKDTSESEPEEPTVLAPYVGEETPATSELDITGSVDDEAFSRIWTPTSTPNPQTIMSAARSDPFSFWLSELGHRGNEVLDYCIRDFWPTLRTNKYAEICYRNRFHQGSRLLLHSVLWATSVHLDLNRGGEACPKLHVETLRYLGVSLHLLQEQLKTTAPADISDEVILSIVYMAVNHQVMARLARDPSPFTPPHTGLHHLNIFGTTNFHPGHWDIVKALIQGRGGIRSLKMVTLPWLVTMAELLHAVGSLQKPDFPLLCPTGKLLIYSPPCRALSVPQIPRHFCQSGGFNQLGFLVPPVHHSVVEVFLDICEYSQCLDHLEQSELCPIDELGYCRDMVHHRFMSLPDKHDANELIMDLSSNPSPDACQRTGSAYLLARLGALLYITHVTFPLPRALKIRKHLLDELSSQFALMGDYFPQGVPLELLLWPATIAAIAAKHEPCRTQFILLVHRLCRQTLISTWDEFRLTMQSFAWADCACDQEGYHVWTDAQLLRLG